MNTVKSFWVGMGSLCVAGGAAYFFAKKQINEDRAARFDAERRRQRTQNDLEYASKSAYASATDATKKNEAGKGDAGGLPSQDIPKSKYESKEPFKSKKGDRFS